MDAHPGEAKKFPKVLQNELKQIAKRRNPAAGKTLAEPLTEEEVRRQALEEELVGLSFSGGGIRSATFNLGILQALADFKLLERIDYLSTVSGGSYIGGWLAAWIKRDGSLDNVQTQLKPTRAQQAQATRTELRDTPEGVEAKEIAKDKVYDAEPARSCICGRTAITWRRGWGSSRPTCGCWGRSTCATWCSTWSRCCRRFWW